MVVDLKANCQLPESRKWSMTPGPHIFFRSGKVERVERGFAGSHLLILRFRQRPIRCLDKLEWSVMIPAQHAPVYYFDLKEFEECMAPLQCIVRMPTPRTTTPSTPTLSSASPVQTLCTRRATRMRSTARRRPSQQPWTALRRPQSTSPPSRPRT